MREIRKQKKYKKTTKKKEDNNRDNNEMSRRKSKMGRRDRLRNGMKKDDIDKKPASRKRSS
ncbi:hypothetical protein AY610_19515 [Bacillus velezensis]|nr:hypothetical protein AY610_19515 [Bacillus velezensis]